MAEETIDFDKFPDPEGAKMFAEALKRVAPQWRRGTMDILTSRNKELLEKMDTAESKVNSLLRIADKPKELKKMLKDAVAEYEHAVSLAIAYADRHLPPRP